jgi:hypothetical protein
LGKSGCEYRPLYVSGKEDEQKEMLNPLDEPAGEIAERRFADAVSDTTMMNSEPLLPQKVLIQKMETPALFVGFMQRSHLKPFRIFNIYQKQAMSGSSKICLSAVF